MRQIKACGFLIVRGRPDSFLLMIHRDRFDLPKGHLDDGESEMQCALRELREETGISEEDIEVDPNFRFQTQYFVYPKKFNREKCQKTLVIFLAKLCRDVSIQVTEHPSFEWRRWKPPHAIQAETIDPLLAEAERHFA